MSSRYDDFDPDSAPSATLDLDQLEARFAGEEPSEIPATKVTTSPSTPVSAAPRPAPSSLNPLNPLDYLAALESAPPLDTRDDAGGAHPDDAPEADLAPTVKERRRFAARPERHSTIPNLFPRGSVNLLIGSSTSGKTLLALSQFELYAGTGEFLGYQTTANPTSRPRPAQLGCIVASGSLEFLHSRIRALGLTTLSDPTVFPMTSWRPNADETLAAALRRHHAGLTRAANHPIHLLFIDGLQLLLDGSGKVNDPKAVSDFYKVLNEFCLDRDVTILATVGQAKLRRNEAYALLSDRPFGSAVWAQEARTLIGIEYTRLDLPEERRPNIRRVVILPRGIDEDATAGTEATDSTSDTVTTSRAVQERLADPRRKVVYADFDEQGRLLIVPSGPALDGESATFHRLDNMLDEVDPGKTFTKDDLIGWGDILGVKPRTVERWVSSRCDDSLAMLERLGTNRERRYRKPMVN